MALPAARKALALAALACALLLAYGYYLQHVLGLQPCPLCLVQRGFFYAVLAVCGVGALHGRWLPFYGILGALFAAGKPTLGALFDNGDFVIVMGNWLSLNDEDDYEIRGRYWSNYGAQSTGVEVMNTTTPDRQTYPAVEKRNDGGFIVVWEGNGFQGDTQGINARAYQGAMFSRLPAGDCAKAPVSQTLPSS